MYHLVPWSSATTEEKSAARERLLTARAELNAKSKKLQEENDTERQIFGRLLAQAVVGLALYRNSRAGKGFD